MLVRAIMIKLSLMPTRYLEHFRAKWAPVRVKEMRPNNNLKPFCESNKVGTALDLPEYYTPSVI